MDKADINNQFIPERPKVTRTLEIIALLVLITLWGFVLAVYPLLPDMIPQHYTFSGEVDSYGSRNSIFILPVLGTCVFIGIHILARYPQLFNYSSSKKEEDIIKHYRLASGLLGTIRLSILLVFLSGSLLSYYNIYNVDFRAQKWIFLADIGIIILPTLYYIIRMIRG